MPAALGHVGVVLLVALQKDMLQFLSKGFFESFAVKWMGSVLGVYLMASLFAAIKRVFTKPENRRPFNRTLLWPAMVITLIVLAQTWGLLSG